MVVLVVLLVVALLIGWRLTAVRRGAARAYPRVVAPDDDPDFLRELDRRTRDDDEN